MNIKKKEHASPPDNDTADSYLSLEAALEEFFKGGTYGYVPSEQTYSVFTTTWEEKAISKETFLYIQTASHIDELKDMLRVNKRLKNLGERQETYYRELDGDCYRGRRIRINIELDNLALEEKRLLKQRDDLTQTIQQKISEKYNTTMKKTPTPAASPDVKRGKDTTKPTPDKAADTSEVFQIESPRDLLTAYSAALRADVKAGRYKSMNEALIAKVYQNETHLEFKTYEEWKKEGYQVRKGEHGFSLWGKPKDRAGEQNSKDDHARDYPVVHVFSNAQVDPLTLKREDKTAIDLASIRNARGEQERTADMER